jgi:DTW domain
MERCDEAILFKLNDEDENDEGISFPFFAPDVAPPSTTKRLACTKCERPQPSACICEALPSVKIRLLHTYCIILQHPNEAKQHQNRTLPFIEHCLDSNSYLKIIGRRFPSLAPAVASEFTRTDSNTAQTSHPIRSFFSKNSALNNIASSNDDNKISYIHCMNSITQQPTTVSVQIWLLSSSDADGVSITLTQALKEWEELKIHRSHNVTGNVPNIVVIALDATWKYANEMDRANIQHGCYPSNQCMRRVRLTSADFCHPIFQKIEQHNGDLVASQRCSNRFSIRTPPKPKSTTIPANGSHDNNNIVHLSTAECLAYVLARIEQNDNIYHAIMKPLDLMVRQWQSHYTISTGK